MSGTGRARAPDAATWSADGWAGRSAGVPVSPARWQAIARAATVSLHDELALAPKPGLVSFEDSGSHDDMDAGTFLRSLFALRHYFARIAALGAAGAPFDALREAGIAAESRMLAATGGRNTHRGAIFTLGLLCAAAGQCAAEARVAEAAELREALQERWGPALAAHARRGHESDSKGRCAARRLGLRPAAEEAALGLPVLFETAWPALRDALARGLDARRARLQSLFATMAVLDDTNLAHRGGREGLRFARRAAADFLAAGGADAPDAIERARSLHRAFVARRLSPGGAADTLAAACLVHRLGRP